MHSADFLRRLIGMARQHGVLVVADEVATGVGRTGTLFSLEQAGVRPDLLCLAKGITGGLLPLAATLTTEAVYDAFRGPYPEHRTFFHGHLHRQRAGLRGRPGQPRPPRTYCWPAPGKRALAEAVSTLDPRHVDHVRRGHHVRGRAPPRPRP